MIGLKRGTVKLQIQNGLLWEKSFEAEKKKLFKNLGEFAVDIQHVGSTSIKGLPAKSIIDIAISIPSLKCKNKVIKILEEMGYNLKKENRKIRRLFFTKGPESKRTHYLHIGKVGGNYINDMILFRDYLKSHPKAFVEYAELKQKLANKFPNDRKFYTSGKEKFIKSIIKKAKKLKINV